MLVFWGVAIWGFTASGYTLPLIMFGYIGTSLGVGWDFMAHCRNKRNQLVAVSRSFSSDSS